MIALAAPAAAMAAGPVSKFDKRPADVSLTSPRSLGDIERCLIDLDGWLAPNVYRQPDRPNEARLLWATHEGITVARIDLRATSAGTEVRAWKLEKQARECASTNVN